VVIGYQGVAQLRPLGGEDFTINLVAVSVVREMGVLITAIMVAGRSGSAFAAELGVMKSRDEPAALQVMGLEPMRLLVLPRLIGLVITLPLLTFFADLMGLLGGAMIADVLLQVGPSQYPAPGRAIAVPAARARRRRSQRSPRRPRQGARLRALHRPHRLHAWIAGAGLGRERGP
jgi:ABC-type transporter Mla maintaining outer membrane lipid asymmetry permease subunit MlaE